MNDPIIYIEEVFKTFHEMIEWDWNCDFTQILTNEVPFIVQSSKNNALHLWQDGYPDEKLIDSRMNLISNDSDINLTAK